MSPAPITPDHPRGRFCASLAASDVERQHEAPEMLGSAPAFQMNAAMPDPFSSAEPIVFGGRTDHHGSGLTPEA